ncbi:hypothetical protein HMPREF0645_1036 [Hallella bergensis DSM 17361]|uniref:Uncharacterized protein n=1 Tax=Hallella bergensis DSM 17361 TaxID=585502 RepID=D1PVQ1_9BACT|nr:hypothetical protein HMPREF0645_1036 [Hallella bergensis DSM 17361]
MLYLTAAKLQKRLDIRVEYRIFFVTLHRIYGKPDAFDTVSSCD